MGIGILINYFALGEKKAWSEPTYHDTPPHLKRREPFMNNKAVRTRTLIVLLISLFGCTSTSTSNPPQKSSVTAAGWPSQAHRQLEAFVSKYPRPQGGHSPIAIFDWDNTVIKNDIGRATVHWTITHGLVKQPPQGDWRKANPYLTQKAVGELTESCGTQTPPGQPLPTHKNPRCAQVLRTIADKATTTDGNPAFAGYNYRTYAATTAWQTTVLAGYTPAEIRTMAAEVIAAKMKVSTQEKGKYIRLNQPIRNLMRDLDHAGFEVWVVSASPQYVVEAFADSITFPRERVIGLRNLLDQQGRQTYDFEGCGSHQDGENRLINKIEGKRCWINQVIFGIQGKAAEASQTHLDKRAAFVAGDATTDVSMLRDATGLRLVIDRHDSELMCYALYGEGPPWVIVPMFFDPKSQGTDPYPCSTRGCLNTDGSKGPCLDDQNNVIPDQRPRY
ncbi:MAG: HAD family hydrolase [Myxococcota bacterium]|nr:HAD family hydrolase [Myxococcota bacterium]